MVFQTPFRSRTGKNESFANAYQSMHFLYSIRILNLYDNTPTRKKKWCVGGFKTLSAKNCHQALIIIIPGGLRSKGS